MTTYMIIILFALSLCMLSCEQDAVPSIESPEKDVISINRTEMVDEDKTADGLTVDASTDHDTAAILAYLTGRFDPSQHDDFVAIDAAYAQRSGMWMRRAAYEAFVDMQKAAQAEGVSLTIVSAARNFDRQKLIWEAKWTGQRLLSNGKSAVSDYPDDFSRARAILLYSSMPGTSRHHWGTDIDLNQLNNAYFESGRGRREYEWLQAHASEFGFCQPYSPKGVERTEGYEEEKWHWSYMPLSQVLTRQAEQFLTDEAISGFLGAHTAVSIGIVEKYVLGISDDCRS